MPGRQDERLGRFGPPLELDPFLRSDSELDAILGVPMNYPIWDNARELSISDFSFATIADGVLTDRSGRSYLVYATAPARPAPNPPAPVFNDEDDGVPRPARRFAEWALYALCGAAAAAAIWFVFVVPRAQAAPQPVRPIPPSLSTLPASFPGMMPR
jgi:hypothetical protein